MNIFLLFSWSQSQAYVEYLKILNMPNTKKKGGKKPLPVCRKPSKSTVVEKPAFTITM